MRSLLLLRGTPGSGKSTFIKNNNLENYTLEADKFRTLVCNPTLNLEGDFSISQKYDTLAWDLLFQCLEERMKKGDFTIIDATHSSVKLVNKYQKLMEKYRYNAFILEMDTSLEQSLEQNKQRPVYKQVPEDAIKRIHTMIKNVELSGKFKKINSIEEISNYIVTDVNKYDNVYVFGDIHGCYTVLSNVINENNIDPNSLYVFVGDYFD